MKVRVTIPPPPGLSVDPDVRIINLLVGATQGPPGAQGVAGQDSTVPGPPGSDGREVELQKSATHVQWRYAGEVAWLDLVLLSELEGPPGPTGAAGNDGAPGAPGASGEEVELRVNATHVQWRLGDGSWADLIALSALVGPQGETGSKGEDGAAGLPGEPGAPGVGVPAGGATGQVLAKASAADYATGWVTPPTLGTAAAADTGDFATAAQGGLADTAVQPADDAADLGSGAATDGYVLTADGAGGAAWEAASGGGGGAAWGGITGTLSDQTDLQSALDAKLAKNATVQSYAGNRTLDADNAGAYVRITAAGTVTLPDSLATGFQCVIVNATASDTVALSAATTLTIPTGYEAEVVNRRAVTVIHVGSNVWEAHGALVETP